MSVTLKIDQQDVNYQQWNFPGGETGILIPTGPVAGVTYKITWNYSGDHEMMVIAQMVDVIRRSNHLVNPKIELYLPYMPYARQDRVCTPGESHALKVFTNWLNSLKFDMVEVVDPHSYVTEALVDNLYTIPQEVVFGDFLRCQGAVYDVLIAPDAGAAKKTQACASVHYAMTSVMPQIRVANKVRIDGVVTVNMSTTGLTGKRVCVIDDICDGGATFISLAECFNGHHPVEPECLDLFVTHGIFSNESNLKIMSGGYSGIKGYSGIYTHNLMNQEASKYVNN